MLNYVAYLAAQERTATHAREALPTSPVEPLMLESGVAQPNRVRQRAGAALRRIADRLDPAFDGSVTLATDRC